MGDQRHHRARPRLRYARVSFVVELNEFGRARLSFDPRATAPSIIVGIQLTASEPLADPVDALKNYAHA